MSFDKIAGALVSPLGAALLLLLVALGVGIGCREIPDARSRVVRALAAFGSVWLLIWSLPVVSHALRAQLEDAYPAQATDQVAQAQAVVVLGGGIRPAERSGQMPDIGRAADRVWLAARLYKAAKAPMVLVSGGSDRAVFFTSEAQAMRELLVDMGVPDAAMLLEEDSRNTKQNALFSARLLRSRGVQKILLVTSALHMPRARALFEAQGLDVVPVPADHEARHHFALVDWLPDADALDGSARAMKELVGRWVGR